jgi:Metallo-peptidase family M12B Reprolysin-like
MKQYKTLLEAAGIRGPISGVRKARVSTRKIELAQTAGPYAMWMEPPRLSARINADSTAVLAARLDITARVATAIVQERRRKPFDALGSLKRIKAVPKDIWWKKRWLITTGRDSHPHITPLELGRSPHILSKKPFDLSLGFVAALAAPVELVQTTILWRGKPYSIQQRVTQRESKHGKLRLRFGKRDSLPVGPVRFQIRLFDSAGGTVEAGIGTYVLPGNPLQVQLTPGNAHFLGWVARPTLNIGDRSFTTVIDWTVSNTTGGTRRFNGFDWIATDGGSGVETIHDGFAFSVGNNSTASFRTTLFSPANSPIGSLLNKGWDFTLRIRLRDDRGVTIESTIVVQPWLGYNANIIRVGPFQAGDRAGLASAANHGSSIYRQVNLTANRVENNWMMTGDTAPWEVIDSGEADDLFQHASVNNDGVDLFIIRDYTGGTGASFTPGDCSKGGNHDGVVMDRRYDGSGNLYWRGMGQTMAHEFGHYFGLPHTASDAAHDFHVMHPDFREDRTFFEWSEYYKAKDHCFILLIF